jgi:1,4-alpha-glucan branching enzyme
MDSTNEHSSNSLMNHGAASGIPNDGTGKFQCPPEWQTADVPGVVALDPWLAPFKESLKARYNKAQEWIKTINETEGGLEKFSRVCQHHAMQFPTTNHTRERRSLEST